MNLRIFIPLAFLLITAQSCKQKESYPQIPQSPQFYIPLEEQVLVGSVVADSLNVPWEISPGPKNILFFTQQSGGVFQVNTKTTEIKKLLNIPDVYLNRTTGLLGLALHPDFSKEPFVYLNYTIKEDKTISSRLMRYEYDGDTLKSPQILYEVPGSTGHNGSRIITTSSHLFWATGDAGKSENAQNLESLNGKVLRFNLDGTIPNDNPLKRNPIWSWGHRNHQGLVEISSGKIFTSEHGDAIGDEINFIKKGKNYGWPSIEGEINTDSEKIYATDSTIEPPIKAWTPTIAPAGLDYYDHKAIPSLRNHLLLATLKERDLRLLKLSKDHLQIEEEHILLDGVFGRLRDLAIDSEGEIYFSTSNHDWNPGGYPDKNDDRIFKLTPVSISAFEAWQKQHTPLQSHSISTPKGEAQDNKIRISGRNIYENYCAACHKSDGRGVNGTFPSLQQNPVIKGSKENFAKIVFFGKQSSSGPENMPGFGFLKNEELAALLTYIRSNFENNASGFKVEEISELRTQLDW